MDNHPATYSPVSRDGVELSESSVPRDQVHTYKKTTGKRRLIIIAAVIAVVAVILIVVLAVVLTRKEQIGLEFLPMPDEKSTLIHFTRGAPSTYKRYTDNIEAYLMFYERQHQQGEYLMDCSNINGYREQKDWNKVCTFDLYSDLSAGNPCIKQADFGYDDGQPCVLIKLNKIYNWLPKPYDDGSIPDAVKQGYFNNSVNVRCTGQSPADQENMGTVTYYPPEGLPFKYFPYLNQEGYLQPIMFAQFANIIPGLVVVITCRAYAENIPYDSDVRFEIMID